MSAPGYHVVNIVLDDTPWDVDTVLDSPLDTYGFVKLPRIYYDCSVCAPARSTLFTGQSCNTHLVKDNQYALDNNDAGLTPTAMLPAALKRVGVRTALIGKYMNGYNWLSYGNNPAYKPYGWDYFRTFRTNNGSGGYYNWNLTNAGSVESYGDTDADYSTDVLATITADYITGMDTSVPQFIYLAPYAPHDPPTPPTRYANTSFTATHRPNFNEADVSTKPSFIQQDFALLDSATITQYDTEHIDALRSTLACLDMIDTVIAALDARGILGSTIIMLTGDNSNMFGEHRLRDKPFAYEECVKGSGGWILYPGVSARTDDRLISNVDLAPTILANFGAPSLLPVFGQDLTPLIKGDVASGYWRTHVQTLRIGVGEYNRNYKALYADLSGGRKWSYAHYYLTVDEYELYDLSNDPYQLTNLAGVSGYEGVQAEMERRLASVMANA